MPKNKYSLTTMPLLRTSLGLNRDDFSQDEAIELMPPDRIIRLYFDSLDMIEYASRITALFETAYQIDLKKHFESLNPSI